jgi:hypothetical protein
MASMTQDSDEFRWRLLRSKIYEENIKKAFEIFRKDRIEPVLIKGWAASLNYPQNSERTYGDIDLCVDPEQFEKANTIAETLDIKKLNIDLHKGFRHLDTVGWEYLLHNSQLKKIDDMEIRVLRPEDHLRILCFHWLNDGGAYKEKLWDIYYAVKNRPEDFDWGRCLRIVSEKRRKWIVLTIGLAAKYLELDISGTPISTEANHLPKWLTTAVEKEWKSEIKLKPLQTCLDDKKEFVRQVLKRLPPNPIQSTIEMEGSFDNKSPRIFYQIGAIFLRITPSLRRINEVLRNRAKEN